MADSKEPSSRIFKSGESSIEESSNARAFLLYAARLKESLSTAAIAFAFEKSNFNPLFIRVESLSSFFSK